MREIEGGYDFYPDLKGAFKNSVGLLMYNLREEIIKKQKMVEPVVFFV